MRRLFVTVCGALLIATMAHAQTPAATPAPPQAPKMDSDDVFSLVEQGQVFFLDVREPDELEKLGTFDGYVNIPLGQIEKRLAEIPKDKAIITA
jgi:predicted sulfurtransferase